MTIEVIGPDQSKFQFPDGTPEATISSAMSSHYGGGAAPAAAAPAGFDPNDVRFQNRSPAAMLGGVPILGAGVPRAGAAISAAAQPLTGVGDNSASFADRYVKNLEQEEAAKLDYEKQHPVQSAVEGMVGGGLALGGLGGASSVAAKALGMTGKLVPAATAAAASGAAIGGADAALRGHDPVAGAEIGALTGAGGVAVGKGVGKVWDAARGAFRPATPVPTRTMPVAGVDVPVPESVLTGNAAASELEQSAIHGGQGVRAQEVARGHRALTDEAMGAAHTNFAAGLDPTGARPSATPMAAGEVIGSEISAQEAARASAEAARLQAVTGEGQALREGLNTSPTPGVLADTPVSAAQSVRDALIEARDRLAGRRDRAYDALRETEGAFNPAVFDRTGARIRRSLNEGNDPVRVDANTPQTAAALEDIELNVGQRRFENRAQTELQRGPDGRPIEPPITAETIDSARKRLISMQRAANGTARRTGDFTDARGMRRIISAFDDHVARAAQTPGGFSGDPSELLGRLRTARGLHTELKRNFGPQNPQDDVGKAIEKIVGKRDVAPAELETVAPLLFGSAGGGGQVQGRVAQRVIDLFGRDSAQVAQLKQGLISHILDTPAGMEPLSHAKAADKIIGFFGARGGKNVTLSQTLFSPSERARFLAHANRMRSAHDPIPASQVEKTVAKWAGRDGGLRASPKTIVDDLMGSTGAKGTAPELVRHLRRQLSPEAIGTLKQGVWSRITEAADGAIPWKDQKVGQRLMNFLNGDGKGMAEALFTKAELKAMEEIGRAHIKLLPVEGTTNPSKSGHVIEKAMKAMAHSMLPFLGFHAGGLPGAAVAFAAKGGLSKAVDRRAATKAVDRFYGPQPRRAASQLPQSFGSIGGIVGGVQSR